MEEFKKYENNDINITVSFGACEYDPSTIVDECINRADKMLYKSKEEGRNMVFVSEK